MFSFRLQDGTTAKRGRIECRHKVSSLCLRGQKFRFCLQTKIEFHRHLTRVNLGRVQTENVDKNITFVRACMPIIRQHCQPLHVSLLPVLSGWTRSWNSPKYKLHLLMPSFWQRTVDSICFFSSVRSNDTRSISFHSSWDSPFSLSQSLRFLFLAKKRRNFCFHFEQLHSCVLHTTSHVFH